jgi:serine protease Do
LTSALLLSTLPSAFARIYNPSSDSTHRVFLGLTQYEQTIIRTVGNAAPSVVSVFVRTSTVDPLLPIIIRQDTATGTGFIVTGDIIITNKHVVQLDPDNVFVVYEGEEYRAEVLALDPKNDIAFLRIPKTNLPALRLAPHDDVFIGQTVIAIGNPLGLDNSVTTGVLSAVGRTIRASNGNGGSFTELNNILQTDAAINPGNSGGPLLSTLGEVIGVNTAMGQNAENIGFAIRIKDVREALKTFVDSGSILRPYLGVHFVSINSQIQKEQDLRFSYGALVRVIVPKSPAEKAGLRVGDVIYRVDRTRVKGAALDRILDKYKVGDRVVLWIWRSSDSPTGTTKRIPIILESL